MNRKRVIVMALLVLIIYGGARYLESKSNPSYESLMDAIASCGTFLQTSFKSLQRSQSDYFIVLTSIVIVVITLIYSLKYLIKPNEGGEHIKNRILEANDYGKEG